jgi:hypothetical protein
MTADLARRLVQRFPGMGYLRPFLGVALTVLLGVMLLATISFTYPGNFALE